MSSTTSAPNEIVIGLVGPVGCDWDKVNKCISKCLDQYRYESRTIRMSEFFKMPEVEGIAGKTSSTSEFDRLSSSMKVGDALRTYTKRKDILALLASTWIAGSRERDPQDRPKPFTRKAHVLRSLKRPEEAVTLRRTYGSRFILISVFVPREERIAKLMQSMKEEDAVKLVGNDEESGDFGQATAKTFELADLFIAGSLGEEQMVAQLHRLFDLYFGSPFVTPTLAEHGMFQAFAASLRSGDLSRQVGAVIATPDGTILGSGANDAPCYGGGQYWPGPDDQRDLVKGFDSNEEAKRRMAIDILGAFQRVPEGGQDPLEAAESYLRKSGLFDITEFGRAVHAELAAILSCARVGVSTKGAILFCTTFPCHNCAKHIVAAGIERVQFIEPYAKSKALELHSDAISLSDIKDRVRFTPFLGIGPRRYVELFSLRDSTGQLTRRKAGDGRLAKWERADSEPKEPGWVVTFLDLEEFLLVEVDAALTVSQKPEGEP
ncbi:MAG: hypothetical protein KA712_06070 [Myxococcales bacterium]|nr:hypothetical protein [Myxococcales bacterium]